jgi:hypothetical protein
MAANFPQNQRLVALLCGLAIAPIATYFILARSTSQAQTPATPQEIVRDGEVRSLPGGLNDVPMFNSNSPEWVKQGGILLSTFPPQGKRTPTAHLNYPLQGRFDLFAHHFTHTPPDLQTLYLGILVHNPTSQPVTLEVLEAASYQKSWV